MPIRRPRVRRKTEPASARARVGRAPAPGESPRESPTSPPPVSARSGRPGSGSRVRASTATEEPAGPRARAAHRVRSENVVVRTDPGTLPEAPRESAGLLELVSGVARRALELGLSAREPSFHVFVAADPEVMIEDDIVRYATQFATTRPTANDIVYVHDFDHPEAPLPLTLPAGAGPALVAALDRLIERLKEEIPTVVEGDAFKGAQAQLASEFEATNRAVVHQLESFAKTVGFGVRSVHGGVQTFPILHGKPVSAEQFDVLDESTKRALTESEGKLTREVDKAAHLVRKQSAGFEAAREAAFSKAAAGVIDSTMGELDRAFGGMAPDIQLWLQRVHQALVDDWDDLVEMGDEPEQEQRAPEERDDPELATRLNR